MVSRARFSALVLVIGSLFGTEHEPWLGDQYEFVFRPSVLYQHYPTVSSGREDIHYHSDDLFVNLSLSYGYETNIDLEAEMLLAKTKHKSNFVDSIIVSGRYQWLDDIAGDPYSFVTGISIIKPFEGALEDVSSFHHGLIEGELFASLGCEYSCGDHWLHRWWLMAAFGMADRGSPWFRGNFEYDIRLAARHELKAFVHTLWGLGGQNLHLCDFEGYGPINHQSADFGLKYTYLIDYFGEANLSYSYRAYARNFPSRAQRVQLEIVYVFPL